MYRIFNRNPSKRRRLDLLHPETKSDVQYDKSVVNYTASSHRIDYDTLTHDFVRACQINGGNAVSIFRKEISLYSLQKQNKTKQQKQKQNTNRLNNYELSC